MASGRRSPNSRLSRRTHPTSPSDLRGSRRENVDSIRNSGDKTCTRRTAIGQGVLVPPAREADQGNSRGDRRFPAWRGLRSVFLLGMLRQIPQLIELLTHVRIELFPIVPRQGVL